MNDNFGYPPNSIKTFTGKYFSLRDLDPRSINIEDIAHGLAMTCRWGGQIPIFYSVAEHSWRVCNEAPKELKLAALLHDASEAYLGDMPKTFKELMPDFVEWEHKLMKVIATKFGFEYPLPKEIKEIDKQLLDKEYEWFNNSIDLRPFKAHDAEVIFLEQYYRITRPVKSKA